MVTIEISEETLLQLRQISLPLKANEKWTEDAAIRVLVRNVLVERKLLPVSNIINKELNFTKISDYVYHLLFYTNSAGIGYTYECILSMVEDEFPESKTTIDNIRWYASNLRKKIGSIPEKREI